MQLHKFFLYNLQTAMHCRGNVAPEKKDKITPDYTSRFLMTITWGKKKSSPSNFRPFLFWQQNMLVFSG